MKYDHHFLWISISHQRCVDAPMPFYDDDYAVIIYSLIIRLCILLKKKNMFEKQQKLMIGIEEEVWLCFLLRRYFCSDHKQIAWLNIRGETARKSHHHRRRRHRTYATGQMPPHPTVVSVSPNPFRPAPLHFNLICSLVDSSRFFLSFLRRFHLS